MIKRTPQEIADFFQCYVAQQGCGDWTLFNKRPSLRKNFGMMGWEMNDHDNGYSWIINGWVDAPADYEWTHLYEPQGKEGKTSGNFPCSDNKSKVCYSDQAASENKPDHTSEIYTEKEFKLIPAFDPARLEAMISDYLNDGFTLYGNPFVVEDRKYGPMIIQAMVRGV